MRSQQSQKDTKITSSVSNRDKKKSVNIKWNSARYFQVGLIVSLLLVIAIMESGITFTATASVPKDTFIFEEDSNYDFELEVPKKEETAPKKEVQPKKRVEQKTVLSNKLEVASNKTEIIETEISSTEPDVETPVPSKPATPKPKPDLGDRDVLNVEFVPVFPGCESLGTNQAKVDCMSSKIGEFVSRKFRTENFSYLDSGDLQRIHVQFKIDVNGNVTDIKARAPDKGLEREAIRVIGKLPDMIPGRQGSQNVNVVYSMPILFKLARY
ncbi:MAG: energy transducer TonB [Flavobacteriales bacterium]|jgi:protein TonB|nr:energy transducer TonB [Flavobacteriales bacterium]